MRSTSVLEREGPERAHFLIEQLIEKARRSGAYLPFSANTAYINTIPPAREERSPGDAELEHKIRSLVRWNAMAMVVRANKESSELGGHIASFASAATLYDVGFNHFWHAPSNDSTAATSCSSRATRRRASTRAPSCEGRITEEQLDNFRQEVDGKGISSYPHPWLMPDFWQFPTVSMGLGPADGDLPGALHALPAGPRHRRRPRAARCGRSWATARWTSPSRSARSAGRRARSSTT